MRNDREAQKTGRRNLLHKAGVAAASMGLLPLVRCTTAAPARPSGPTARKNQWRTGKMSRIFPSDTNRKDVTRNCSPAGH